MGAKVEEGRFSQGPEIGLRGRNATDRPLPLSCLAVVVNGRVERYQKLSIDSSEFKRKLMAKVVGASHNKVDDRS